MKMVEIENIVTNEECLSSLIIREMKVKTTKRCHHLTPVKMTIF